ncbi:TetR/AcrR family transcriptional regulator [Chitinophaga pinensis]|uniref:TetR/AcrR family transcriptional regulator n=1 Tax=Chitinophaga pinensis TaxID=79329 RepID=UPI001C996EFC|nr:TetR/AcrR family transcriptional regulator [Chitinophaga pinensis]
MKDKGKAIIRCNFVLQNQRIMGSKERIQRLKDDTRRNILTAALNIVKEDGWQALNMRRIALDIDYTAPVIYEYFDSKESLIAELTYQGYAKLLQSVRTAGSQMLSTVEQLLACGSPTGISRSPKKSFIRPCLV